MMMNTDDDLFKKVDHSLLIKCLEKCRYDMKLLLNNIIKEQMQNITQNTKNINVEYIFENKGITYKVRRNPIYMRAKKRGGDGELTEQKAQAVLCRYCGDEAWNSDLECVTSKGSGIWEPITADVDKVSGEVERIIGVDAAQFSQMAMLAQGEFQKFLNAKSSEKEMIFRRLFHTEVYEHLQQKISEDSLEAKRNFSLSR